ncbi:MAG: hypothetical protein HYS98_01875, partial [Deltaproteobacteria bacterium]|nr:hypothetical protein [Deltaproteobacteria bacterium]
MHKKDLPPKFKEFLDYCDAVHKQSTVGSYVTSLKKFCSFATEEKYDSQTLIENINRSFLERFLHRYIKQDL